MNLLKQLNEAISVKTLENLLLKHKIQRIKKEHMAELDGESKWDLDEDIYLHITNYGRTAAIYYERNALKNSHGIGAGATRGWLVPVSNEKEDFVKRYPWLKTLADSPIFKIDEKANLDDFEEWVLLWANRQK